MTRNRDLVTTRRKVIGLATSGLLATPFVTLPSESLLAQDTPPPIDPELVHEFVRLAHGNLEGTRAMLEEHPRLIYASWDWGDGDFETALGGAAHMGRKDIAGFLLEHGARLDLFSSAMLGLSEVVEGVLNAYPSAIHWKGAHGISLIRHAQVGQNDDLVAYLEALL